MLKIKLTNSMTGLARIQDEIEHFAATHNLSEEAAYNLRLTIEELVSNVIRHGYTDHEPHIIHVHVAPKTDGLHVTIEDDGRPFDPNLRAAQPATEPASEAWSGRGLAMVRSMVGRIDYERDGDINRVSVRVPRQ